MAKIKEVIFLISVVVPIYNVEDYLVECIESILNQTYTEFELILVNDGSTDNSLEICNQYSKKDDRIKIVNKKNGGLSDARNAGIDVAKGEYIIFIDSDDFINKNMFKIMFDIAKSKNADIVQCNYKEFYNKEDIKDSSSINNEFKLKELTSIEALYGFYDEKKSGPTTVAWNKLYKTALFEDIRYPYGKIHEDVFTTYKLIFKANKIVCTEEKLYYYRQRENSITTRKYNKKRLVVLEAIEERKKFMKDVVNNEELYNLELKNYYCNMMSSYVKYKKSNPDDKETLKEIKKNSKRMFRELIKCNKLSIKKKLRLIVFFLV